MSRPPEIFVARVPVPTLARSVRPTSLGTLSVVVPLLNEESNLAELLTRLDLAVRQLPMTTEILFVNDGSTDGTAAWLDAQAAVDPRIVVIHFSRNFGHQAAISAGLEQATGDAVAIMDGDLQDPPEILQQFLGAWRSGADVVYAIRTKRKENFLKRLGYFVFYRLLARCSELPIPLDAGDFCWMDRRVVDAINALPERQRFVRGLRTFVGFQQVGLPIERAARASGSPKYTFRKLIGLAADGLFQFSSAPLRWIPFVGLGIVLIGALLALGAIFSPTILIPILAAISLIGGLQLIAIGMVAEYIRRIFNEVKARPSSV
ncbi:MAG: glycosyltransferase family 2 protein, partial [Gemmataceae bacterium]